MKMRRHLTFKNEPPEIEGVEHKPLYGFEEKYQCYTNGQIWSRHKGCFLYQQDNGEGYLMVYIFRNYQRIPKLVHRAVVETFIRPMVPGEQVNHINNDSHSNQLENLQILTEAEHKKFHVRLRQNKQKKYNRRKKVETCKV